MVERAEPGSPLVCITVKQRRRLFAGPCVEEEGEEAGRQTPYNGVSRILSSVAGRKRGGAGGGVTRVWSWRGSAGPVLKDSRLEGICPTGSLKVGECPRTRCWTGGTRNWTGFGPVGGLKAGGSINQHRWRADPALATTPHSDFSTTLPRFPLLRLGTVYCELVIRIPFNKLCFSTIWIYSDTVWGNVYIFY